MTAFLIVSLMCVTIAAGFAALVGLIWPQVVLWSENPRRYQAFLIYSFVAIIAAALLLTITWPDDRLPRDPMPSDAAAPEPAAAERPKAGETLEKLKIALERIDAELKVGLVALGNGRYRVEASVTRPAAGGAQRYVADTASQIRKMGEVIQQSGAPVAGVTFDVRLPGGGGRKEISPQTLIYRIRIGPEDFAQADWDRLTDGQILDLVEVEATDRGRDLIFDYCAVHGDRSPQFCLDTLF
jgi:hypothetical protein